MPPGLPPPQSKGKGSKSQNAALANLLKRFPGYRQYMPTIRQAAARWGMDPVLLLATLAWENGAANTRIRNSAGARGLAQIVDQTVGHYEGYASFIGQYAPDGRITDQRAFNPVFAINYMAWRMTAHIHKYGTLNGAYDKGYNPGFTGDSRGKGPAAYVPSWYWSLSKTPPSAADQAGRAAQRKQAGANQATGNPWLQGQAFLDYWHQRIDPIYQAYAGRSASRAEARDAIKKGLSDYTLQLNLASKKSFIGSPIWKTQAPGYQSVYRDIYGDRKPDARLITFAIIHNLGATGFAEKLRQGKGYVKSNEFAGGVATLQNVYQSIFGSPDANAMYVIKQATLHGWTTDQFAKYLRAQPEYQHSDEFRSNAAKVAAVFGGTPTLSAGEALAPPAPTSGVPQDPRLGPPPWAAPTQSVNAPPKKATKAKTTPQRPRQATKTAAGVQP
jgi:hypothetical protein